jgi:hypothetical protein
MYLTMRSSLCQLLASLPLLWLQPDFSPADSAWDRAEVSSISEAFL